MAAPARRAAFQVLRTVSSGRGDLGDALRRARDPLPDARDRALATDLAAGTLRWRNAIDYQLQLRSAKALHKLDTGVLDALRLGGYQLLYLERVPTSAVVNDSVDLVKDAGFRSAAGYANAVLRRLAREREALTWPAETDALDHLSVVYSHPAWLVRRWIDRIGLERTKRWVRFNNEPPGLTLAPNRLRVTRHELIERLRDEGISAEPTRLSPHGVVVTNGHALSSATFAQGYCVVQDEASQLIPELARATRGEHVLDLCASPGGKTLSLAAQCGPSGMVVASDVRRNRVALLAATMQRCGADRVRIVHIPATGTLPFQDNTFDCILIDAPCSGLGTIRRDPDIRWRRDPADFASFSATQRDLLRRAAPLVKSAGRIVYSTCSSEPEENESVINDFLADARWFAIEPLQETAVNAAFATREGFLQTTPDHGLEVFFGAILRKR